MGMAGLFLGAWREGKPSEVRLRSPSASPRRSRARRALGRGARQHGTASAARRDWPRAARRAPAPRAPCGACPRTASRFPGPPGTSRPEQIHFWVRLRAVRASRRKRSRSSRPPGRCRPWPRAAWLGGAEASAQPTRPEAPRCSVKAARMAVRSGLHGLHQPVSPQHSFQLHQRQVAPGAVVLLGQELSSAEGCSWAPAPPPAAPCPWRASAPGSSSWEHPGG